MRRKSVVLTAVLLLYVAFAAGAGAAGKIDTLATLAGVKGDVQVQRGAKGEWAPAKEGALLREGDVVKTGAQSACNITWSRGNAMHLTAFTTMRVDRLSKNPSAGTENTSMQMWMGKVYAQSKKLEGAGSSFDVKTPTAVAGVRGTKLAVGVDADETTNVECLDGSVQVQGAAGGEVMLGERQKTSVKKNEQPSAPEKMKKEDEDSFQELNQATGSGATETEKVVKNNENKGEGGDKEGNVRLSVSTPSDGFTTRDGSISVAGSVTPASADVSVNGMPAAGGNGGVFSATVNLMEGENEITVQATSKNGATQSVSKKVTKDTTPPRLDLMQPAGGQFSEEAAGCAYMGAILRCTVIGRSEVGASVNVGGQQVGVQSDGSFSVPIALTLEDMNVNVSSTDSMGNRSTMILTRVLNLNKVDAIKVTVSPGTITANETDTAVVTVETRNIIGELVTGTVSLSVTTGGSLADSAIVTTNGVGSTTFTAGVGGELQNVTITAMSGGRSGTANVTLLPDTPPIK